MEDQADNLHPLFKALLAPFAPPNTFSEAELLEADLLYLEGQARRDRERIRLLQEEQLMLLRARGGL